MSAQKILERKRNEINEEFRIMHKEELSDVCMPDSKPKYYHASEI
jgi:hypothetical protein